ncbi:hypothetical protein [Streptomyces lasiicapitis]|uniref:hypothetical protein n=1 Tax=Streptomyces lasiicapitis TaxID=1923961 RepID=UPI0036A1A081
MSVTTKSSADEATFAAASYVRKPRMVLAKFPAGGPYGSQPADEFAKARQAEGVPARVVMDLRTDAFLVIVEGGGSS